MDPYAAGVLRPEVHDRLVANLELYASQAGIRSIWITRPLAETCSVEEVAWVTDFKFHQHNGRGGLVLCGKNPQPDAETRMSAIAGALTRNFIVARVSTLNAVMAALSGGETPEQACLLIPNFCMEQTKDTKPQAAWRAANMHDMLVERHVAGRITVLYAEAMERIGPEYGQAVRQHVENHYDVIAL